MRINSRKLRQELTAANVLRFVNGWNEGTGDVVYTPSAGPQDKAAVQLVLQSHNADAADLEQAKRDRQDYINSRRDKYITEGVTSGGIDFDTDPASVNNLTAAIVFMFVGQALGAPVPSTVSWRDAANQDRDLNFGQLFALGGAMFTRVQTAHQIARQLKDQIETLDSVSAINAVDWP